MKHRAFTVSWHADSYNGTFNYTVVADSLQQAKKMWDEFTFNNKKLSYSWEKAKMGVENHHGGYISWKNVGETDKEPGCYEEKYDAWNTASDHLWD